MSVENIRERVEASLADLPGEDFETAAQDLLAVLGYPSERTIAGQSGTVADFMSLFDVEDNGTKTLKDFRANAASVRLLFQLTDSEIAAGRQLHLSLPEADLFNRGLAKSFFFVAVELNGRHYARGKYAQFTREINKWSQSPTVVLFKTSAERLTLAFVHRREHKRNPERDVLGRVSLVREIDPKRPHQAHIRILEELSLVDRLKWMDTHHKPHNFDGLLAAWLDALDTEELNRRFYKELFAWFERAVTVARFPTTGAKVVPPEEHIIGLITRLLFVWFIKEKNLIADELFNEAQVRTLLRDYDRAGGGSYYRAVLQNLFFATLNTEIDRRGFSKQTNDTHRDFSRYRYRTEMSDPVRLLALFQQTPFINGGLFDCLDSEAGGKDGGYRIDCFTDNVTDPRRKEYGILSIPNQLFFDDTGLISMFNRYKFTIEENTPAEQEVALDPELLGKVFENLLAVVTPETSETARKQTGSYYTPRAVVDYMVDESLVTTLAQKCAPEDGDTEFWQDRLRYLLDYDDAFDDAENLFKAGERAGIVRSVAEIKVIDPAVGSGAFPMGVLHKLTLALRRLDAENELWEALQKDLAVTRAAAAFDTDDQTERDDELTEISEIFEKYRSSDFGRKLYLVQNSIFGVDIQPVACQIAKLRFFISLAIEQEPTEDEGNNFGIKPLPNLETRFVAADTLLALEKPAQLTLGETEAVARLEQRLNANRERHFHATTRPQKLRCRRQDKQLRQQLAATLKKAAFSADAANNVATWDPYDQNAFAAWFDPEYMFGVKQGFDVVVGNPPYIQLQKDGGALSQRYKNAGFTTRVPYGDIYQLFYEKGCQLLRPGRGLLTYITSNSWLRAEYGKSTRRFFSECHTPLRLLEMGKDIFENTIVDTNILLLSHGKRDATGKAIDMDRLPDSEFPPIEGLWGELRVRGEKPWSALSAIEQQVMDKMEAAGTPLGDWGVDIYRGVTTGYNKAFIVDDECRKALLNSDPKSADIVKRVLRGRDVQRYQTLWAGLWLIVAKFESHKTLPQEFPAVYEHLLRHEERLRARGQCRYSRTGRGKPSAAYAGQHHWLELDNNPKAEYIDMYTKEKLVWMDLTERGRIAYDDGEMLCLNTAFIMLGTDLKYICAVLNSRLITWFMRNTAQNSGMGVTRWIRSTVQRIPVPRISVAKQAPFIRIVDLIIQKKAAKRSFDATRQEMEIDQLVYQLYGLTKEEIRALERTNP